MTHATGGPVEQEAALREQLASFRPLLALSIVMTSSRDETEILRIATTAVPSLGGCRAQAVYLDDDWRVVGPVGRPAHAGVLHAQLDALDRFGGAVDVDGASWSWAYPLASLDDMAGYLVVSRDTEPEPHHQFLLTVLVQQTGAALANARLHSRERASTERERAIADELRATNLALERAMTDLARSSAALQCSLDIHNQLTAAASAGEGQQGIARALHQLTRLPVAIEDHHGNLTAWAGPDQPDPYPKPTPARREQTLRRALDARGPVRDKDRLIAVAQPGSQALGTIALVDPDRIAGDSEKVALEHANTVLTLELAHLRALAEAELRLRRDLVEELLAGTDPQSAQDRARALGYDLARPHRVLVITNGSQRTDHEAFYHAVRRAVRATGVGSLLAARPGGVAVLCDSDQDWEQFRAAIIAQMSPQGTCQIGVGAPCTEPPEFPRSHGQAQLALKMQLATGRPDQVTVFEDLGIYQLLSEIANIGSVEAFIHRWLGILLDYDTTRDAQLVDTLSCYLECGGNYDLTAKALCLHRSTLRYRLQRIRDISGHDLNHPDTRFNLQLAARAWKTVHAMGQQP
ncbi:MAG TPA: helix-turn-helix domain-containing protein [Pseudonocardiaceae bacterium]|nr:helix-turn-helix domain-containing protein [Pseudonocardiaceae bacterium]